MTCMRDKEPFSKIVSAYCLGGPFYHLKRKQAGAELCQAHAKFD